MKEILLMRFRSIAANLRQYISTSGTMYSKFFGFAGGRERPVENSAAKTITKLYQIANGILKLVDTALLHILVDTSVNTKAMGKEQYTENLLLCLKTVSNVFGVVATNMIVYCRGLLGVNSMSRGSANVAVAEKGQGNVITHMLHKATAWAVWITYSKGGVRSSFYASGRSMLSSVLHGSAYTITKSIEYAFSNVFDAVYGKGIILSKLLANASVSNEEPANTLMKLYISKENHLASSKTVNSENISLETEIKLYTSASVISSDVSAKSVGSMVDYFSVIARPTLANSELSSGITIAKTTTIAGPIVWQNPKIIENNTLYIASVYNESLEDSTIYIE